MSSFGPVTHRTVNISNLPPAHMGVDELCTILQQCCGAIERWTPGDVELGVHAVHSVTFADKDAYNAALLLNGVRVRDARLEIWGAQEVKAAPPTTAEGGTTSASASPAAEGALVVVSDADTKTTVAPVKKEAANKVLASLKQLASKRAGTDSGTATAVPSCDTTPVPSTEPNADKIRLANTIASRLVEMQLEAITKLESYIASFPTPDGQTSAPLT